MVGDGLDGGASKQRQLGSIVVGEASEITSRFSLLRVFGILGSKEVLVGLRLDTGRDSSVARLGDTQFLNDTRIGFWELGKS